MAPHIPGGKVKISVQRYPPIPIADYFNPTLKPPGYFGSIGPVVVVARIRKNAILAPQAS